MLTLQKERGGARNNDYIILQQMSAQIKLLDDNLDFQVALEKTIRTIEGVGSLLQRSSEYVTDGAPGASPLVRQLVCVLDRWLRAAADSGLMRTSDIQLAGKRGGKAGKHHAFVKKILELIGLHANDGAIAGLLEMPKNIGNWQIRRRFLHE